MFEPFNKSKQRLHLETKNTLRIEKGSLCFIKTLYGSNKVYNTDYSLVRLYILLADMMGFGSNGSGWMLVKPCCIWCVLSGVVVVLLGEQGAG